MAKSFQDTYKMQGLRRKLVEELGRKGMDRKVLDAFGKVPRHFFLDSAFGEKAYEDNAFPIGEGQTISQPYTVAYQTQLLEIKPNDKILEIGTGSGYQAAILATMGAKVYSIERMQKLHDEARYVLNEILQLNVRLFVGDGTLGFPRLAPYDKIIVTAAAPITPEALLNQLKPGGCLVIPVGDMDNQEMQRITKNPDTGITIEKFDSFRFVPLIGKAGW